MIARLALSTTLLVAGTAFAMAQSVPRYNIENSCKRATSLPDKLTTLGKCVSDENGARAELQKDWQSFLAGDRQECLALTSTSATPSYVELLECLNMARDARRLEDKR